MNTPQHHHQQHHYHGNQHGNFQYGGSPFNNNNMMPPPPIPNQLYGYGRSEDCEDQMILRLPPHLAEKIHKMIKQKHIDTPIDIQFKSERNLTMNVGSEQYQATLLDLPCILETHKTSDRTLYYKSGDIGQMIQVHDANNNNEEATPTDYRAKSGITPPTKDIATKKFKDITNQKFIEMAKTEEELVRIIKPGYVDQEEFEFVTLEELREQYGNDMFSDPTSTETIIFEERADDQVITDLDDSGDESINGSDNENPLHDFGIKLKTKSRRTAYDDDPDWFPPGEKPTPPQRRHNIPSPITIRMSSQSPLDSEKSPGSVGSDGTYIPHKKERKTRSDKGKERVPHHLKVANQHLYQNQQHNQHRHDSPSPSSTTSTTPTHHTELRIKLPITFAGSSSNVTTSQQQSQSPMDVEGFKVPSSNEKGSTRITLTTSQSSEASPISPKSSEERKKHKEERRQRREERRKKKHDHQQQQLQQQQHQLQDSESPLSPPPQNVNTSQPRTIKITGLVRQDSNQSLTQPQPTPPQSQQPITQEPVSTPTLPATPSSPPVSTPTTTTTTTTSVSTPQQQQQQNTPQQEIMSPSTPPVFSPTPTTPPISSKPTGSAYNTATLQLLATQRKLKQEADAIKKRIDETLASIASLPNKILKDRQQAKADDFTKQYNAKLKEIEDIESQIAESSNQ